MSLIRCVSPTPTHTFRPPRAAFARLACGALVTLALLAPGAALAHGAGDGKGRDGGPRQGVEKYEIALAPVPHDPAADGGSQATGRVSLHYAGNHVTVRIEASGLSPNLPHAQHIHGVGLNRCPGPERRDDRVNDGLIDTVEGLPDYGPVRVSLTTRSDASAASGLAVDRFPVANANGELRYKRTFKVEKEFPRAVAEAHAQHHVVLHGIDINRNGA